MSATTLEPPRQSIVARRETAIPADPPPPRPRPGRRVTIVALGISALFHVILLGIRFGYEPIGPAPAATQLIDVEAAPGMRVFDVVAVEADVPTPQAVVDPRAAAPVRPDLAQPPRQVVPPGQASAVAPAATASDPLTVSERLAPRVGDPRLFTRPAEPLQPELEPLNNVRARVYAALDAYNDSMAGAAADAARAMDWTVKDASGGRWGVSPGQLHLGSISLPLPFGFQVPPGRRDEYNERMRTFTETQQQASRAEVEKGFRDRVDEIRARKNAARDSTRRGGGGG
jgi:hypothetical protein